MRPNLVPLEILDRICEFIAHPSDLLAFSRTCKTLQDVITPDHLQYRVIRCDLLSSEFWNTFVQNGRQAARIRCLEIVPIRRRQYPPVVTNWDETPIIPKESTTVSSPGGRNDVAKSLEEKIEAMTALARAITNMPNLQRFHWHTHVCPSANIFSSLFACSQLRDVEVLDWFPMPTSHLFASKLWALSNLTRFSFTENSFDFKPDASYEIARKLGQMLLRCPELEDLQLLFHWRHPLTGALRFAYRKLITAFETVTWEKLKRLTIDGRLFSSFCDDFCQRHPTIEAVCLSGGYNNAVHLDGLGQLQSLAVDWIAHPELMDTSAASRLRHLEVQVGQQDMDDDVPTQFLLLPYATHIESSILRFDIYDEGKLLQLIHALPATLSRLALQPRLPFPKLNVFNGLCVIPDKETVALVLEHFPYLTHFCPIYLEQWSPIDPEADENKLQRSLETRLKSVFKSLLKISPDLQFIGVSQERKLELAQPLAWYKFGRNESGNEEVTGFREVTFLKRYKDDIDVEQWGGIYRGAGRDVMNVHPDTRESHNSNTSDDDE